LNVAFHALSGLAIGEVAAARMAPAPGRERRDLAHDVAVGLAAFALAIMSHGVLDGLPHEYPFRAFGDTLATAALVGAWMAVTPPRLRAFLLLVALGAVVPDVIDHVPRDLNRHLGLHLAEIPKVFPWHRAGGSGSLSGDVPRGAHLASLANHSIVLAFCAAAVASTRLSRR
jgi:hypothetical protein